MGLPGGPPVEPSSVLCRNAWGLTDTSGDLKLPAGNRARAWHLLRLLPDTHPGGRTGSCGLRHADPKYGGHSGRGLKGQTDGPTTWVTQPPSCSVSPRPSGRGVPAAHHSGQRSPFGGCEASPGASGVCTWASWATGGPGLAPEAARLLPVPSLAHPGFYTNYRFPTPAPTMDPGFLPALPQTPRRRAGDGAGAA